MRRLVGASLILVRTQRIGRMGCDAFALLPLTTHDQPVGVLCISCESAEQLRGNVPELLLSISTFVSFALDAFATESDRRRVQQEHEAALALSEKYRLDAENTQKHLVSVINRVNDGMTAMDRDWNYTFVNQQAARMLRHDSPEDLIGKCIWDIYPDGIGKSFHQACEQAFRTQQPGIYEEYYREHDRWFENRIFPSAEGWTIYFSDITDRKKTELALRDAATAFANIRDAVMVADENLSIIRINPAFSRITGFSDAEAIGTSAQILNCGKGTGTFERIMSSLSSQGHWQGRASIGRKCGDVFPAWLTANAIEQSSDTSGHFVVVFSDLSDDIQHSFTPASVSHS